jgi:hypothetical protein
LPNRAVARKPPVGSFPHSFKGFACFEGFVINNLLLQPSRENRVLDFGLVVIILFETKQFEIK